MIRLGITNDLIALPIVRNFTSLVDASEFAIKEQSLQKNYDDLLNKNLDAAFISPADYAKDSSLLKLVKDVAIYSKKESRLSLLFFQEDLLRINEIVYQASDHYKDLASLVLNEFFHVTPSWEPAKGEESVSGLLDSNQAVFLGGEIALENFNETRNRLDMTDQWWDKTGFSFIHQVIAMQRDITEVDWIEQIYNARDVSPKNLRQISEIYSDSHKYEPEFYLDLLTNFYHYTIDENIWNECAEYLKYLFYYGKIRFIPQFNFV